MGRRPRIEFEGGAYHAIQRGNNKEYIIKKDNLKKELIKIIKESKEIMNYKIYGFVIMDNHYHIVIRTHEVALSEIMHRVNLTFSKYYNFECKRSGHVFQDRYKGILVKDDKYLLSLLRYVHQNPVKAKMCKKVSDYFWGSDSYYRNSKLRQIVDIDFVLDMFSENRNNAIIEYKKFMDSSEMEESSNFEDSLVIGEVKTLNLNIQQLKSDEKTLDDILREVTDDNSIFDKIKNGSRKRNLTIYKKLYVQKALLSNYKMKEIGLNIGISESAVYLLNNMEWGDVFNGFNS